MGSSNDASMFCMGWVNLESAIATLIIALTLSPFSNCVILDIDMMYDLQG